MEKLETEDKDQKQSRFQWFLFVILIPLLFAITLMLVILTVADVNVFKEAKDIGAKIPVVSSLITANEKPASKNIKNDYDTLQVDLRDKEKLVKNLQDNMTNKDSEINQLKLEIEQLNRKIADKQAETTNNGDKKKAIIEIYETMSPKNAAAIISKLQDDAAITILSSISVDKSAGILEKMDPVKAAKYTELLTNKAQSQ